ncbi:acetyltransferase [Selenomonas sp. oral taxon 149]|uniref:acetyltransferase n=1 Tax=Selenomonas sp. oral taxon 149 TaxID=712535 RepID=UPI0001E0E2B3|nr:acetyltransferase [Selenomonas sp. oral taxon 149]EFM22491.1 sugar O-acyltransferase, sialic acid O-acetyltransferase NeuD family [Selenomonas sp. oral taxon 149 str. 67H29BP]
MNPSKDMPVILLGSGGHAKVVLDLLLENGFTVCGMTTADPVVLRESVWRGIPVLGDDDALASYPPESYVLASGIGSVGIPTMRMQIHRHMKAKGYFFPPLIARSAIVKGGAVIGEGVQIHAGAVVQTDAVVGENAVVNTRAVVEHECVIGQHSHVATGAILCGQVTLGSCVHVGAGATIRQCTTIGENVCIGAGSVVTSAIDAPGIYYGVPARKNGEFHEQV